MLDIKFIRENVEVVKKAIVDKRADVDIDELLDLDSQRRTLLTETESLQATKNAVSKEIPQLSPEDRKVKILEMQEVDSRHTELSEKLKAIEAEYEALIQKVPNIPSHDTPVGPDESGNLVVREWGEPKKFSFTPKEHWKLGAALNLIDTETASKVSGSRFAYLKGALALMEFGLIQIVMQTLTQEDKLKKIIKNAGLLVPSVPFTPIIPPVFIKPDVFQRMGRLEPKEERYYIPSDDAYLIGSAEHTLGPLHMDKTIPESELPIRYIGFSTAFRREAGSYGRDLKGILRVHQFDKLEMESFTTPDQSLAEQEFFVAIQEHLMQLLKLPYQVVQICTGDMGGPDSRQIDINTWMPGQNKYRETHTSDLMTDYQSRRLNIKYKKAEGKTQLVHMNDATASAGRTLIAIMENYQQEDGSIVVPEVLRPYVGVDVIVRR